MFKPLRNASFAGSFRLLLHDPLKSPDRIYLGPKPPSHPHLPRSRTWLRISVIPASWIEYCVRRVTGGRLKFVASVDFPAIPNKGPIRPREGALRHLKFLPQSGRRVYSEFGIPHLECPSQWDSQVVHQINTA